MEGIQRSEMEEEIFKIWSKPLKKTPVFKDLPRLAGRITVIGQFAPPKKLIPTPKSTTPQKERTSRILESQHEPTVREFLISIAERYEQTIENVEKYVEQLENHWYFHVDSSLLLISDDQWKEYGVPSDLIVELKKAAEIAKTKEKVRLAEESKRNSNRIISPFQLSEKLISIQLDSNAAPKTFADRLEEIHQESNEGESNSNLEVASTSNSVVNEDSKGTNKGLMSEIARVVLEVASRLETKEKQATIKQEFDRLLHQTHFGDMELEMESLFKVIGDDSATTRVFKAIHQNIIFAAVFQLRTKVPSLPMTRDVRSRDGWRIEIIFTENIIVVSHTRREQSLATAPSDEQYWFEWELKMIFEKHMSDLESSILRIKDLNFDEKINPKKRELIAKALSHGNLIVS